MFSPDFIESFEIMLSICFSAAATGGILFGVMYFADRSLKKRRVADLQDFSTNWTRMEDFLSRRFDILDCDGNGLILRAELYAALENYGFKRDEEDLLHDIILKMPLIGHVIASWSEPAPRLYRGGSVTLRRTISEYGITRNDMSTVAQRTAEQLAIAQADYQPRFLDFLA